MKKIVKVSVLLGTIIYVIGIIFTCFLLQSLI